MSGRRADDPLEVKRRLTLLRRALGLQPSEIAKRLHISQQRWSNWESVATPHQISKIGFNLLRQSTKITYEWVYFGDISGVPYELAEKIQRVEQSPEPAGRRKRSKSRA